MSNDEAPRKRAKRSRPRLVREYDQNAVNRRAYMTLLADLPNGHIMHSGRVRSMICQHLMVPGVRAETRTIYKLYGLCRPQFTARCMKAIRDGMTIYELGQRGSGKELVRTSGLLGSFSPDEHGIHHITVLNFVMCMTVPKWYMNWRPLHRLTSLTIKIFYRHSLTRAIPGSFCDQLPNLQYLSVHGGVRKLPSNLSQLRLHKLSLKYMNFAEHGLPELPATLKTLVLSECQLQGRIPDAISRLPWLQTLELDHNHFTGSIPSWMNSMKQLAVLDLAHNQLTGPFCLDRLTTLNYLDLRGNFLDPRVPGLPDTPTFRVCLFFKNQP